MRRDENGWATGPGIPWDQCSGDYDDGIADGNLTRCSVKAGCGLKNCPSEIDRQRRQVNFIGAYTQVPAVKEQSMGHYDSCYEYDAEQKKLAKEKNKMSDAVSQAIKDEDEADLGESQRREAERLSLTKLGFEVELTISSKDLDQMLRDGVRQLLENNGLSKSMSHLVDTMTLQVNSRGAYTEIKDPVRFSNKKT